MSKLRWPEVLVKKIQSGKNDINSIAYDMYALAYNVQSKKLMYIEDTPEWREAAELFKKKSCGILD